MTPRKTLIARVRLVSAAAMTLVSSTMLCPLGCADPVSADPSLQEPTSVSVVIDWKTRLGEASPSLYGSNDTLAGDLPIGADDPGYAAGLKAMGISVLRIHNAGLTEGWTDPNTRTWVVDRIKAGYDAPYLKNAVVMQTIPVAPAWCMQADGFVDPAKYAAACAALVNIVNNQLHCHVRYWEPMNEWNMGVYTSPANWVKLCDLFNQCAVAMKAQDPTIDVGGPALAWPDLAKVKTFLQICGPNAAFISWHEYGTGDAKDASDLVMSNTHTFGDTVTAVRSVVDKAGYGGKIKLVMDEFNVNYDWRQHDDRTYNNVGAVFLASVLKHAADASLDIGANWNAKADDYGLLDSADHWRPAARVYQWMNHDFVGDVVSCKSSSPMLEVLAVKQPNGLRSVLLINKSAGPATVTLNAGQLPRGERWSTLSRLDASTDGSGETAINGDFLRSPVTLTPYSLLLIRASGK